MNYYLQWSREEPKHPSEVYDISWETGWNCGSMIFPNNISFDEWKKEKVDTFEKLNLELKNNGRIKQLKYLDGNNPSEIEKDVNFIEWCK
jgi:hypothetical protein